MSGNEIVAVEQVAAVGVDGVTPSWNSDKVTRGQAPCALDYAVWAWGDLGGGEAYCII